MGNESIRSGSASTIGTKAWYIIGHVLQGHGDLGLGISNTDTMTSTKKKTMNLKRQRWYVSEKDCKEKFVFVPIDVMFENGSILFKNYYAENPRCTRSISASKHCPNTKVAFVSAVVQWNIVHPSWFQSLFSIYWLSSAAEQVTLCKIFPEPHLILFLNYWIGYFISKWASCSITVWLAVKSCL